MSSVFQAKALAIKEACIFCVKSGLKGVIIESDNLAVIDWCKSLNSAHPGIVGSWAYLLYLKLLLCLSSLSAVRPRMFLVFLKSSFFPFVLAIS